MHPKNKWLVGVASATLISFVSLWEGVSTTPYIDVVGVETVCYGQTLDIEAREYTLAECQEMLKKGLIRYGNHVLECIDQPLTEKQYAAFTSFAYNVGVQGACNSRAIRYFNEGKPIEACKALSVGPNGKPVWSFGKGKFLQGLYNRRKAETKLCLEGST